MYHPEHGITNYGEIINDLELERDDWQARAERAEAEAALWKARYKNAYDKQDSQRDELAALRAQLDAVKAGTQRLITSVASALLDKEVSGEIEGGAVVRIAKDTVAELLALRAQVDAAGWRPGTETPPHKGWYMSYDLARDDAPQWRYHNGDNHWGMWGEESPPQWYMQLPGLPPAPDGEEARPSPDAHPTAAAADHARPAPR